MDYVCRPGRFALCLCLVQGAAVSLVDSPTRFTRIARTGWIVVWLFARSLMASLVGVCVGWLVGGLVGGPLVLVWALLRTSVDAKIKAASTLVALRQ